MASCTPLKHMFCTLPQAMGAPKTCLNINLALGNGPITCANYPITWGKQKKLMLMCLLCPARALKWCLTEDV